MNPIELGKFIAILRNEKHITQEELADMLFIDKRKISRWECGKSVPEFDMLIKLSKILDVSLYELSIGKRIIDEKLTTRIVNKFKNLSDFKRYKTKIIIERIFILLLFIFFIIMTIYTFKYHNTVEIFELNSLDEKYYISGNVIKIKNEYEININKILYTGDLQKEIKVHENCNYEIFHDNTRIIYSYEKDDNKINYNISNKVVDFTMNFNKIFADESILTYKAICNNQENYTFDIKLIKKFDNKIF